VTTTALTDNSHRLRTAGILLIVSAVVTVVAILLRLQILAEIGSTHRGAFALLYLPTFAAGLVEEAVLAATYVVFFLIRPIGRLQWVFLVAACGHVLDAFAFFLPAITSWSHWIAVAGTLASGIYVLVRRLLTPWPSIVFFVTVIVGLGPVIYERLAPPVGPLYLALGLLSTALFALSGIALVIATRARTRSTATV
jgi:hypothetical protein